MTKVAASASKKRVINKLIHTEGGYNNGPALEIHTLLKGSAVAQW